MCLQCEMCAKKLHRIACYSTMITELHKKFDKNLHNFMGGEVRAPLPNFPHP